MIGQLRGVLVEKQPPFLLIDVRGVGYEVQAPMTTFYRLPEPGAEVLLYTHLSISDAAHQLFGFAERSDRTLFRTLIKVTGVGPRSEEHTSELQSRGHLVCRLLLEKKKIRRDHMGRILK